MHVGSTHLLDQTHDVKGEYAAMPAEGIQGVQMPGDHVAGSAVVHKDNAWLAHAFREGIDQSRVAPELSGDLNAKFYALFTHGNEKVDPTNPKDWKNALARYLPFYDRGVKPAQSTTKNLEESIAWHDRQFGGWHLTRFYLEHAERGSAAALCRFAEMQESGEYTFIKDAKAAHQMYGIAAKEGSRAARVHLALNKMHGNQELGIEKNTGDGLAMLKELADDGSVTAQKEVARYFASAADEQQPSKAAKALEFEYISKAAGQGDSLAKARFAELLAEKRPKKSGWFGN